MCLILVGCSSKKEDEIEPLIDPNYSLITKTEENVSIETETVLEEKLEPITEEKEIETATSTNEPNVITISFAGDCTLGSFSGQGGKLFHDYYDEYGSSWAFQGVKEVFEKDDLTFVNLEGPLTNQVQTAVKQFPIKGKPEYVNCLLDGDIEVCNLSNNHIYDCGGNIGLNDTIAILDENGIGYCGEGTKYETNVKGVNICFLGYMSFGVSNSLKEKVASDILTAKESGSDIVIVEFHGGIERDYYSASDQEDMFRTTIDNGADVVIAAHPHVIQGIELYNGKVICYSLGNFSFGANCNPADKDTFIFQQQFIYDSIEGTITYGDSIIIPCSISSEKNCNTYQPTLLEGEDYDRVMSRLKEYSSKYKNTIPILENGGY